MTRPTVAVIGAGVSGLTAAYLLSRTHSVTLYEAEDRLGGHAHTHDVTDPAGNGLAVDTGFIVHNDRTYPHLRRLFGELGIATRPTEMSMSISDEVTGIEYAGGRGIRGIFAQPNRAVDPRFLAVLGQVRRFHRRASAFLAASGDSFLTTLGDFLDAEGFSPAFRQLYALPLVSCVWSTGSDTALQYPARYLFRFLDHHGMLGTVDSPQWSTVVGGSRTYVDAIAWRLRRIRSGRAVRSIHRYSDGVRLVDSSGTTARYGQIVIATHADTALGMLADPSRDEKEVLSAFGYARNETVLHTDARLLPRARQARAAWNYLTPAGPGDRPPVVTYWMNRLQGLTSDTQYLVTLNARDRIDPATVLAVMDYEHPVYDPAAVEAQTRLATLTTGRVAYAGAYHGWGFHEDGCRSGVAAARAFGTVW
jgi:predicted NAD/FAD-binding protein